MVAVPAALLLRHFLAPTTDAGGWLLAALYVALAAVVGVPEWLARRNPALRCPHCRGVFGPGVAPVSFDGVCPFCGEQAVAPDQPPAGPASSAPSGAPG
jgi:hypothetical protein